MTRAVALTAHHDDAVLWCGGAILRTLGLGWEWTIVAMCTPDGDRQTYFDNYCESLNVKRYRSEFQDYQSGEQFSRNDKSDMKSEVECILRAETPDLIFTHSRDQGGEYGDHTNHHEVRTLVEECSGVPIVNFCYRAEYGGNGRATVARKDADFHLQLNYDEIIRKAEWCRNAPDCESSLKNLGYPCPNPEGFRTTHALPTPFVSG